MGTMKKYLNTLSIESASFYKELPNSSTSTGSEIFVMRDFNGTQLNLGQNYGMKLHYDSKNLLPVTGLIPYATQDLLTNYNFTDYSIVSVGTMNYTALRTISTNEVNLVYNCTVANNTAEDITFSCIKFSKNLSWYTNQSVNKQILMYAYFLDEPITVAPGQAETVNINFKLSTDL